MTGGSLTMDGIVYTEGYVFYRSPLKYRVQFFDKESRERLIQEICRLLEILKDR